MEASHHKASVQRLSRLSSRRLPVFFFSEVFVSYIEQDRHVDPSVAASDQYAATLSLFRVQAHLQSECGEDGRGS
jgi:hypothetical protein